MNRMFDKFYKATGLIADAGQRSVASRVSSTIAGGALGFALLGTFGVDTSPLITAAGITGATIGFASKDFGSNFVASIALSGQPTFRVGNDISVGTGTSTVRGIVVNWDTRYIYLDAKGSLLGIPNSTLLVSVVQWHNAPKSVLHPSPPAPGAPHAGGEFSGTSTPLSSPEYKEWKAEASGAKK